MATTLSKEEYLKRYLSGGTDTKDEKKKKKKKDKKEKNLSKIAPRMKIIDNDAEVPLMYKEKKMIINDEREKEDEDEDEEDLELKPTIAHVQDERPEDVRIQEQFQKSGRWKTFQGEDIAAKLLVEEAIKKEIKEEPFDELDYLAHKLKKKKKKKDKDRDKGIKLEAKIKEEPLSPVRKYSSSHVKVKTEHNSDDDSSAVKRTRHDSDDSPPRRRRTQDSDDSPPRRRHDSDNSPPRRRHDSDNSPPRRRHDSDASPPRRRHDSDTSPPRRRHDSDASLPRRRHDSDASPPRTKPQNSDSDQSPPRKRQKDSDSDASPPRRRQKADDDSDMSPPRRPGAGSDSDASPPRRPMDGDNKMKKTLDGKRAGLQKAADLKTELEEIRNKEKKMFDKMDTQVSGRFAETKVRGRLAEAEAKKKAEQEKKEVPEEIKKKFETWNRGVAQVKGSIHKLNDDLYEMSKSLTRTKDDVDRDAMLKEQEREEDPMAAYMRKKKEKKEKGSVLKFPRYTGPQPPTNRFGIWPGYRWDGVVRSNGFEVKLLTKDVKKNVEEIEAYKMNLDCE